MKTLIAIKTKILLTTLLAVFSLNPLTARAESCDAVIKDAISYLQTPISNYYPVIKFEATAITSPAKFVNYASGTFKVARFKSPLAPIFYLSGKDIQVLFSDRTWVKQLGGGFIDTPHPFDPDKADIQQISLFTNSTASIVLTTWGNAKHDVPLQCSSGLLYGIFPDSMIVFSLKKDKEAVPK
jgi:hypothetical protein